MGFIIGDAFGVPLEFIDKQNIPINLDNYIIGGKHNVPTGAWSDDSSLMLCLLETLTENGLDYNLLSKKMIDWLFNAYMTPCNKTFGVGRSCLFSIGKLSKGISYLESGENQEKSNGNGSLMRILPLVFYLEDTIEKYKIIETCSAITHAHSISKIACSIFIEYFHCLIKYNDKYLAYKIMQKNIKNYYKSENLTPFNRILEQNIYNINKEELSGLGYVISTLEVALYSFINSNNYSDCIQIAVRFGNDTDTNAAIAGSLAGYYYNAINNDWHNKIINLKSIQILIFKFIKLITPQ